VQTRARIGRICHRRLLELIDHSLPKPATEEHCCEHSYELGGDESCDARRRDSRKRVGQRAGNGDGGIANDVEAVNQ